MNTPNMTSELFEAIHCAFVDYPDVEGDCLVFLSQLAENKHALAMLSMRAEKELENLKQERGFIVNG